MPSPEQEFVVVDWENWPRGTAAAEAFVRDIPLVVWERDPLIGLAVEVLGEEVDVVTARVETGT